MKTTQEIRDEQAVRLHAYLDLLEELRQSPLEELRQSQNVLTSQSTRTDARRASSASSLGPR